MSRRRQPILAYFPVGVVIAGEYDHVLIRSAYRSGQNLIVILDDRTDRYLQCPIIVLGS